MCRELSTAFSAVSRTTDSSRWVCRCTRRVEKGHTLRAPTCHRVGSACRRSGTISRWPQRSSPAAGLPNPVHDTWSMLPAPSARIARGCLTGDCLSCICAFGSVVLTLLDRWPLSVGPAGVPPPCRLPFAVEAEAVVGCHAWCQAGTAFPALQLSLLTRTISDDIRGAAA